MIDVKYLFKLNLRCPLMSYFEHAFYSRRLFRLRENITSSAKPEVQVYT